jgi:replicative DNA helicase
MSEKDSANMNSSSSASRLADTGPVDVNCILRDVIDQVDRLFNDISGVSTGFTDLDGMTQGLHEGELIVVAGRPSMGKTTFALNLVENALQHSEKAVVVYSPVMPAKSLVIRMLSSIGKIDQSKLRNGRLEDDDWPKLTSAVNQLKDRKLSIDDDSGISLEKIRSRTRQLVEEYGAIGLIVVDDLKRVQLCGNDLGCRSHEVAEIVFGLKSLAQEFECSVVVTSGICRDLEKRQNKRPQCYDLSDSSTIEQVADVILLVYRDEIYNRRSKDKGVTEIIVAKQRLGYTGTVRLSFEEKYAHFENLPPPYFSNTPL